MFSIYKPYTMNIIIKISLIAFMTLVMTNIGFSQKKTVKSKIKEVTVFQNGAQIYREANVNITKGHQIIRISNLSNQIDMASIQLKGKGKFTIMSVTHQINYLKQIKKDKRIKRLNDSIILLTNSNSRLEQYTKAYGVEVGLLKANQSLKGQNSNLNVAEIKQAADFFRKRFREIYLDWDKINQEKSKNQLEINKIRNELQKLQNRVTPKGVGEILVEIESPAASNVKLSFDYLVRGAGWTPQYDLRAMDINSEIQLHYRANVYQNTGIEWKNVILTVSTGNPRQNRIMPVLSPWYLQFRSNVGQTYGLSVEMVEDDVMADKPAQAKVTSYRGNSMNSANYTTVTQSQTNTKFKISLPYTIPSTNKKVSVKVQKWLLPASYRYYCAPRISEDVFLQARITGWEELSLMPGNVNIFFDGTFVSKSHINPRNISDTLDISLGVDKAIIVKRKKVKNSASKAIVGVNKKMKVAWDISIKNNKSKEINLFLMDQIPLSYQENVEITLNDKSGADYNVKSGFLSWNLKIKPRSKKLIDYQYQIKYPKDLILNGIY